MHYCTYPYSIYSMKRCQGPKVNSFLIGQGQCFLSVNLIITVDYLSRAGDEFKFTTGG